MMLTATALLSGSVSAKIFLQEDFSGDWESRWVKSSWKEDSGEAGKMEVTAGKWFADEEKSKGLQTAEDAKFYAYSTKFPSFSTMESPLVVQFSVKHEQSIDCGGGYAKLFPGTVDQATLHGGADEDKYNVMFGPDICGYNKRTHVIFEYKGTNHLVKKEPKAETDTKTHLYTLLVNVNGTYEVFLDMESIQSGALTDDWDFLPPKMIQDPEVSKPEDWIDDPMMEDPEASKPEGWDDIPKDIPDPDATVPDDWDEEDDGVWEPPTIDNPKYKGEWIHPKIDNPDYKGEWVHPEIDNPDYKDDDSIGVYSDFGVLAFEIWQVKSGTIFDSIIITDDEEEANAFGESSFTSLVEAEKKAKDVVEEAKKAAEAEAEAEDTDDDEDEDDEEEEPKDEL